MPSAKTTAVLTLCCTALLSVAAAGTDYQGSFDRKFQVNGPAQLEIATGSWDVHVHSGPAGEVTVSGKIHVSNRWLNGGKKDDVQRLESNPPIRQAGNTIHIERENINNVWIDYDVTVPADTSVRSNTGSGDVTIEGLRADVDLESGSGDLRLDNIRGSVHTHSGSGDVEARQISGPFTAQATSGDVRLSEMAKADVEVRTSSGNIHVTGVTGGLQAQAGSGDLTIDGTPAGAWDLHTGSGDIRLHVPGDAAFNLDVNTSSGNLNVNHAVTMTVQGRIDEDHHSVRGTVRGGGPEVTVRTGSGDIEID